MSATTLLQLLKTYLEINALFAAAFVIWKGCLMAFRFSKRELTFRHQLFLGRGLLLAALLLPLLATQIPDEELLRPSAQIWSGAPRQSEDSYALVTAPTHEEHKNTDGLEMPGLRVRRRTLLILLSLILAGFALRGAYLIAQIIRLKGDLRRMPTLRSVGKVRILGAESQTVPFAVRTGRHALIALPVLAFLDRALRRMVLEHEGQHHRQADTRWSFGLEIIKVFGFGNPAVFAWISDLSEIQELACDEYLIGHRNISPQAYGRCLWQTAQHALRARNVLVGTTSMSASHSGQLLKRRISVILKKGTAKAPAWAALIAGLGTIGFLATTALASRSLVQEQRITMNQAQSLAQQTNLESTIPVTVNPLVLKQLNKYVGTPEGRKFIKASLNRMPLYQGMIERWIKQYDFPEELLAVPLVESGYKDTPRKNSVGAGLWGFIKQTGLKYGLEVDPPDIDDRLDNEKETEAAMKYFKHLDGLFHDWRLDLKAYNEGEGHVQDLMAQYNSTDPWYLESKSESKEHYLSEVTAVILIMKNPGVLG